MKFYLGIKFHNDLSNKDLIERICSIAEQQKHQIICDHRDLEEWGEISFSLKELMIKTFEFIENSDAVIIEFSESGVGLGIEAGFAVAKNIPVYVLLPKGRELSPTMQGICKKCFEYETDEDIQQMFRIIKTI
ncbi:hypothetical protein EDC19_0466 [Natranaerovirga hydrolytica]|uniref:Nucleoside 2-deoxyribosyltransferase-like protein n=1 Tax=Natranaerovirga hydrolytica TaxID=680378 RepID=A0A4V2Q1L2_9FIRM|nr:nucleoside 2-deoxyribosyltransferase [Natranaerovirga hydrolytica]TCK98051.1 hypothetical protein EDC19_0466 [Natranaerovirga hydrolytica]